MAEGAGRKERKVFGYYTSPAARRVIKIVAAQDGIPMKDVVERWALAEGRKRGLVEKEGSDEGR